MIPTSSRDDLQDGKGIGDGSSLTQVVEQTFWSKMKTEVIIIVFVVVRPSKLSIMCWRNLRGKGSIDQ